MFFIVLAQHIGSEMKQRPRVKALTFSFKGVHIHDERTVYESCKKGLQLLHSSSDADVNTNQIKAESQDFSLMVSVHSPDRTVLILQD